MSCGFFARLASGHGRYLIEVQLQAPGGEVLWKEGPSEPWDMLDPLKTYHIHMKNLNVVFPMPDVFDLVLLANGDEISRQRFGAVLVTETKAK